MARWQNAATVQGEKKNSFDGKLWMLWCGSVQMWQRSQSEWEPANIQDTGSTRFGFWVLVSMKRDDITYTYTVGRAVFLKNIFIRFDPSAVFPPIKTIIIQGFFCISLNVIVLDCPLFCYLWRCVSVLICWLLWRWHRALLSVEGGHMEGRGHMNKQRNVFPNRPTTRRNTS